MFKSFFGTKAFYKSVIAITIPIMIQQGLTSIVSLLDNVMVGQLTKQAIAGVAIANQILFVCMAALMGGLAGPGIFVSQFHGAKDKNGLQQAFKTKVVFALIIAAVFMSVYALFGHFFMTQFLSEPLAVQEGMRYFNIIILTIIPIALVQLYGSSFREIGRPKTPMYCGLMAVILNLIFNYILIFGHFGFPALGVAGAALATLLARSLESILLISLAHARKYSFADHVYQDLKIAKALFIRIVKKGLPLLGNEIIWSTGMTVLVLAYALRGSDAVAAFTISGAVSNLFYTIFAGLATGIAVFVGSELGANRLQEASDNAKKIITFSVMIGIGTGILLIGVSSLIPLAYNVDDNIRHMATSLMRIIGVLIPVFVVNVGCFFVMRAGGATLITFAFDSGIMWLLAVPVAYGLATFTNVSIFYIYLAVQGVDVIKMIFGMYLVSKKTWVRNLTLDSHI